MAKKRGVMHVRTPAGVKKYGLPIGTVIKARPGQSLADAAKALKAVIAKRGTTDKAEIHDIAANPLKGDKIYTVSNMGTYAEYEFDGKVWHSSSTGADATPATTAKGVKDWSGRIWATKADPSKNTGAKPLSAEELTKGLDDLVVKPKAAPAVQKWSDVYLPGDTIKTGATVWKKSPDGGWVNTATGSVYPDDTVKMSMTASEMSKYVDHADTPVSPAHPPPVGTIVEAKDMPALPTGTKIIWGGNNTLAANSGSEYIKTKMGTWATSGMPYPQSAFDQGASNSGYKAKITGYKAKPAKITGYEAKPEPKHVPVQSDMDKSPDITSREYSYADIPGNTDAAFPALSYTDMLNNFGTTYTNNELPEASAQRVRSYTGSWAGSVNPSLREGEHPSGVKDMDRAFRPMDKPAMFYRSVPTTSVGVVHQATSQDVFNELKKLEGKSISDKGYMSTSYDLTGSTVEGSPFFTLRIRAPKGTPAVFAQPLSGYQSEHEVILPRDMPLKVNRVEWNRGPTGSNMFILDVTAQPDLIPAHVKKSMTSEPVKDVTPSPASAKPDWQNPEWESDTITSSEDMASAPVGTIYHSQTTDYVKQEDGTWEKSGGGTLLVMPENKGNITLPEEQSKHAVTPGTVQGSEAEAAPVGTIYHAPSGDDWVKKSEYEWEMTYPNGHTTTWGQQLLFTSGPNPGTLEKPQEPPKSHKAYVPETVTTPGGNKVISKAGIENAPIGSTLTGQNEITWTKTGKDAWTASNGVGFDNNSIAQGAWTPDQFHNPDLSGMVKSESAYEKAKAKVLANKPEQKYGPGKHPLHESKVTLPEPNDKFLDMLPAGGVVTDKDGVVWTKTFTGMWMVKPPGKWQPNKTSEEMAKIV